MKILKPGKVKMLKLVCPNCGCEFVYEYFGNIYFTETARVNCPQEGCKGEVFLQFGEPYEGPTPTQDDKERLSELVRCADEYYTTSEFVNYLIAHGVTFKETPDADDHG